MKQFPHQEVFRNEMWTERGTCQGIKSISSLRTNHVLIRLYLYNSVITFFLEWLIKKSSFML